MVIQLGVVARDGPYWGSHGCAVAVEQGMWTVDISGVCRDGQ